MFFSQINSCVIPNSLEDLGRFFFRNHPELCLLSAPEPSSISSAIYAGTLRNLACYLHRSPLEPSGTSSAHQPSAPEPSRTSSAFCPEPSAPEPFGTLSAICTRTLRNFISLCPETLRNLISHLHRNPPEPCLLSAPELSGTSSASCPGTVRNLISHLHRNPPEPHQQCCTGSHQSFSGLKTP